ncbi:tetratricopeptide repeat protein [Pseudobacteriovorax antillogorgiicola]|uniref:SH3 domain-containing protein n=1 Tax=Pseudobacteriovorax antillogorgiicola TaxID=1513793 RepID=A0A1Y6BNL3_9BACT|nr:tetratricopeptide repeat protein [Pseudobacteriovorax antillogorgiicola]TCS53906.1 SH3 domain-containing protein [Pseudobacteriovorax antillogorgiicola]SMF20715.1 SH3 domain-containing protein [Pseudobacteriovorax antillogorgiicola]
MLKLILPLICFSFFPENLGFGEPLGEALGLYQQGKFEAAAQKYRQALSEEHQNASVLFNLGNSYYKAGDKGRAMAAYLRAQDLAPRDPDIKANIEFLQKQLKDQVTTKSSIQDSLTLKSFLSLKELFFVVMILVSGAAILISFGFWSIPWRKVTWSGAALLGLLGLMTGSVLGLRMVQQEQWGAVTAKSVDVYAGPSDQNSVVVFKLHEGAAIKLLEKQGRWYAIELADQKRGWLPEDQALFF